MGDSFSGLSVFVAAADAGSFAAAAEKLHLSRSAVGKIVARLESRLGVRLFHRTTRSQSLTDDGQAYYEHCMRALKELQTAEAVLETGRKTATGRLRISMPVLFGRRCVAPILCRLAQENPGIELELSFNDRMVDLVEDGFDLAVRNGSPGDGKGLMTRRVAYQRMTVCASPAYLATYGTPQAVDELGNHRTIAYLRAGRQRSWLFPQEGVAVPLEFEPESRFRFDDLEAIADAAAEGIGLAWLPCWLIRERVRSGKLERVPMDNPGLVFDCYVVWQQATHMPLRVRMAIDALAAELPNTTEA